MSYQTYYPNGWQSGEAGRTPITPEALNHIEAGILNSAPAGYGLGLENGLYLTDCNDAVAFGLYMVGWQTANNPLNAYGALLVLPHNYTEKTQILTSSQTKTILVRHEEGGAWTPWEWENPPMVMGVEYRTTKRWSGKPVYTKSVGCGAMGQNVEDVVTHNAANVELVRVVGGYWYNGTTWHSVPYYGSIDNNYILASAWANNIRRIHKGNYYTIADMSVVLEYTKTTD